MSAPAYVLNTDPDTKALWRCADGTWSQLPIIAWKIEGDRSVTFAMPVVAAAFLNANVHGVIYPNGHCTDLTGHVYGSFKEFLAVRGSK
jgi:hypothetical protein